MLDSLHIKNFRCFEDLTIPSLGRVNLIVGKNNSGKSTLLEAVALFSQHGHSQALKDIAKMRGEVFSKKTLSTLEGDSYIGDSPKKNYIQYEHHLKNGRVDVIVVINGKNLTEKHVHEQLFPEENHTFSFIKTTIYPEKELAKAWDKIRIQKKDQLLKNALQIIDKNIDDVFYTTNQVTMISVSGEEEARSIKSMGEGMSRLLQIFLYAYQAKGGYLMIDEFENGLHYSIQEEVWEKLFDLAKELDIQVFATTHSQDTIKAFSKIALQSEEEGRLISLGRNEREIDKGKITALTYNEDEIKLIAETGMEVR
ncbi:AAA family ATPase [Thiothrix winogradskyi]|uniref:AAA family ATPase n=1 Tax=Thiothrix winogradskyi TaxID=96472 RepID=A0ABY3SVI0_9GAMM|nr:AAA family ATPase [Thiothrix winogradskyi]UJS23401.1 AAA family ATPase [Thiothrix winogradskyi]